MAAKDMVLYQIAGWQVAIENGILSQNPILSQKMRQFLTEDMNKETDLMIALGKGSKERIKKICWQQNCMYPMIYCCDINGCRRYHFERPGVGEVAFEISPTGKTLYVSRDTTRDKGATAFNRLGAVLAHLILQMGGALFHGTAMDAQGQGILVMAPAGTGKTTHTDFWEQRGFAEIINGDRCLCRKIEGKWYVYGFPWSGSSQKNINRQVPIAAIVILSRGNDNKGAILNAYEAELALLQRIYASTFDRQLQESAFEIVHALAKEIPVIAFECLPETASVDILKGLVDRCPKKISSV